MPFEESGSEAMHSRPIGKEGILFLPLEKNSFIVCAGSTDISLKEGFYLLADTTSHAYNAELVKQLAPEMQAIIANYGSPIK